MASILPFLAGLSLAAQLVFFLGLGFLVFDLASLVNIVTPEMHQDSSLLTPYIRETFESYGPTVGVGVLGAIATYVVYYKTTFRALWFLRGTRVLGWLWLPFIPVGTFIGIVLLGARRDAVESQSDT